MHKRLIISFVLLCSLLLFACSGGNGDSSGAADDPKIYQKGYEGLEVTVIPPSLAFEHSSDAITVFLENKGAYDARDIQVSLLGLDDTKVLVQQPVQQVPGQLEGLSLENPPGLFEELLFPFDVLELRDGVHELSSQFFVKTKYRYSNEFSFEPCISLSGFNTFDAGCDADTSSQGRDFRSQSSEKSFSFQGQGSPLAVQSIEILEDSTNKRVSFIITLQNNGPGEVDNMYLTRAYLSGEEGRLECTFEDGSPSSFIFERNQREVTLICKQNLNIETSHNKLFQLAYDYVYEEAVHANLRIRSFDKPSSDRAGGLFS